MLCSYFVGTYASHQETHFCVDTDLLHIIETRKVLNNVNTIYFFDA